MGVKCLVNSSWIKYLVLKLGVTHLSFLRVGPESLKILAFTGSGDFDFILVTQII